MFIKAQTIAQVVVALNANSDNDYQTQSNRHGDVLIIEYPADGGESIEWSVEKEADGYRMHC